MNHEIVVVEFFANILKWGSALQVGYIQPALQQRTDLAVVFRLVNEYCDCFDFCLTKFYKAK